MEQTATADTGEAVSVPAAPVRDPWGNGYDWIDQLSAPWAVTAAWGRDGYDLGAWPYIVFAQTTAEDAAGALYGYCTYVEGDITARWYRTEQARTTAISKEAFWYWASGQADGPEGLRGLDPKAFRPIDGLCEPYRPSR